MPSRCGQPSRLSSASDNDGQFSLGPPISSAVIKDAGKKFTAVFSGVSIESPILHKVKGILTAKKETGETFVKGDDYYFAGLPDKGYVFNNCNN